MMEGNLPAALDTSSGFAKASASFGASFKGDGEQAWQWASYNLPVTGLHGLGGYGYGGAFLEPSTRQHRLVSAVANDLVQSDPVLAALVEQLATQAVGANGLTLSLRLPTYASKLGMTETEARALADEIESAWRVYTSDPRECDAHGVHDFASLVHAGFRSYLLNGEALCGVDWSPSADCEFATKAKLMSPLQIATDKTQRLVDGWTFEGVVYNKRSRNIGLYLRDQPLGETIAVAQPKLVPLYTSWGRPRIIHALDLIGPNSPRGISPLAVALGPSKSKATIHELTTASYGLQNSFSVVVHADMSPDRAIDGLQVNDSLGHTGNPVERAIESRAQWYGEKGAGRVQLEAGKVTHLHPGDKLDMVQPRAAGQQFHEVDTSLLRLAAAAAGVSYDQLASDYSKTSFSAAKLSGHLPFMINLRRRAKIAAVLYQRMFDAWLEECVERKIVHWPGTRDYWDCRKIIAAACVWRGPVRASADPLKDVEAAARRVHLGISSLTREAAELLGEDIEDVIAERKAEVEALNAAGLWGVVEGADTVTDQHVDKVQEDVAAPENELPQNDRDALEDILK